MCDKNCANKPKYTTLETLDIALDRDRALAENRKLRSENNNLKLENTVQFEKIMMLAKALEPKTSKPTRRELPIVSR